MKSLSKKLSLARWGLIFFSGFLFLIFLGTDLEIFAQTVEPHLELSPSSGAVSSSGTEIEVIIDTGGQGAKSAKAVINFDASLLEVTSVQAGDFFDDVSHNIYNSDGEVVINANLSFDSMLESKTGIGSLATMTVAAKASTGTAEMTFDCTQGSSTDSNIQDANNIDIITCESNIGGLYSLGGEEAGASPSPGTISSPAASSLSSPLPGAGTAGGTGGAGAAGGSAPVPVTGISAPTIGFLLAGLLLILTPLFL